MRLGKRGAPPGREDFEVFVQSHGARLARAAYVLTGNERDSEDLVQETMLLAFRNWTAVHAAHNQGAYVRRILVNRYISDKRRPRVLSQALTEGDAGGAGPGHRADRGARHVECPPDATFPPTRHHCALLLRGTKRGGDSRNPWMWRLKCAVSSQQSTAYAQTRLGSPDRAGPREECDGQMNDFQECLTQTLRHRADSAPTVLPDINGLERMGAGSTASARGMFLSLGAVAAAAAVVLGIAALGDLFGAHQSPDRARLEPRSELVSVAPLTAAPAGSVFVGVNRAAITIPSDWTRGDIDCGYAKADTVIFESSGTRPCALPNPPSVSSVHVAAPGDWQAEVWSAKATIDVAVEGRQTFRSKISESDGFSYAYMVVPSEGAFFKVISPDPITVQTIVDSLQILPEGQIAIPYLRGVALEQGRATVAVAGLEAVMDSRDVTEDTIIVNQMPPAGTVVPVGSEVTLITGPETNVESGSGGR